MKYRYSIILVFVLLLSMGTALASTPQDLILQARADATIWDSNIPLNTGDIVTHEGKVYQTIQAHNTQSDWQPKHTPALFIEHIFYELGQVATFTQPTGGHDAYQLGNRIRYNGYIFESTINDNVWSPTTYSAGWQEVSVDVTRADFDSTIYFIDHSFVSPHATITGLNLTGTETKRIERQLVALDNYNPELFNVTIYTGNDNIKYSVYRHDDVNANRTTVRQEGSLYKNVYSQDGFVTYETDGFSTQILSVPDVFLVYNDFVQYDFDTYFSGYTEDEVFFRIESGWSTSGCASVSNDNCKLSKGVQNTFPPLFLKHYESGGSINSLEIIAREVAYTSTYVSMNVNDGSNFIGDEFQINIAESWNPTVSTNTPIATSPTSTTFRLSGTVNSLGSEDEVDVYFRRRAVGGAWATFSVGSLTTATTFTSDWSGLTPETQYEYEAGVVEYLGATGDIIWGSTQTYTTTATPPPPVEADGLLDGLVAYYKLDETSGTTADNSEGTTSRDGTANNARVFTSNIGTSGQINSGADFTQGDDTISITDRGTPFNLAHTTGVLSISFWVNVAVDEATQGIMGNREGGSTKGFFVSLQDNKIRYMTTATTTSIDVSSTSSVLAVDGWTHVVVVPDRDNTQVKFYLDGELDATVSTAGKAYTTGDATKDFFIGATSLVAATGGINGFIDEVGIWDRTLSSAEVSELYATSNGLSYDNFGTPEPVDPPSAVASIPVYDLELSEAQSRGLDSYFIDYDTYAISFINPVNSALINLTTATTHTNDFFSVAVADLFGSPSVTVTGFKPITAHNINFQVCNDGGCADTDTSITVTSQMVQTQALPDVFLEPFDTHQVFLDDYFSNAQTYSITWVDPLSSSVETLDMNEVYFNDEYRLDLETVSGQRILNIEIPFFADPLFFNIEVSAYNENHEIFDSFDLSVTDNFEQVQTFSDITHTIGEAQTVIDLQSYIVNADSYSVSMGAFTITEGETETLTDFYNITLDNDLLYILALEQPFNETVSVTATKSGENDISDSFVFTAILPVDDDNGTGTPPPVVVGPTEFDDFFNMFGSTGSNTMRFIVGMFAILAAFFIGFSMTKSIIGGLFFAIMGLIFSVIVGLIPIWVVLLIIILMVIPMFFMWYFKGGAD